MSRNGSGTYTLPAGNPVVTGTTITTTWANNTLTDIATALTGSLSADGQTTATGALQMGSNKITGLANGTVSTDAVALGQLGTIATQNANAVAITGGAIDGTTIGTTTRADGKFTTLAANGDVSFTSTGFLAIPAGTTAQRPVSPVNSELRYNTTTNQFEGYANSAWSSLGGGAAGSNTQIQYNNSGALAGSSDLTLVGTTTTATAIKTNTLNTTTGVLATQNGMTGIAKAYLNYNASTQTVRASFNISSVTYNGTGDITLNFATAMPDANYTIVGSVQAIAGTANPWIMINGYSGPTLQAPTTSACRVFCQQTGTGYNSAYICISIFGA